MDEKELAHQVKEQKQEFIKAEREDISKVLENTMSILEKDGQKWERYCTQPFYDSIGETDQFDKDTEKIREQMLEKYEANLEKTKEDLEELFFQPLSDKMEARKERALTHIHKKLVELDKGLGREPRERDDGFCREMER